MSRDSFRSCIVLSCIVALLACSSLSLLVSAPVVFAANQAPNSQGPLKKLNSNFAGYELSSAPTRTGKLSIQSQWSVPDADCSGAPYLFFTIQVIYQYNPDVGSQLLIDCRGQQSPLFSIYYYVGGRAAVALPAQDIVSPEDLMVTVASVAVATGFTSVTIKDLTAGWSFSISANEGPPSGKFTPRLEWALAGPGSPLLFFYNFQMTTNNVLTIGAHHGFLASFLSVPSVTVAKYNDVNATGHLLAKTSAITSTSPGFTITWVVS
jgi:hypothetical protein